ncbi:MAG: hypothetical protein ACRC6V_01185 [Bacteroidales bacterium]
MGGSSTLKIWYRVVQLIPGVDGGFDHCHYCDYANADEAEAVASSLGDDFTVDVIYE